MKHTSLPSRFWGGQQPGLTSSVGIPGACVTTIYTAIVPRLVIITDSV